MKSHDSDVCKNANVENSKDRHEEYRANARGIPDSKKCSFLVPGVDVPEFVKGVAHLDPCEGLDGKEDDLRYAEGDPREEKGADERTDVPDDVDLDNLVDGLRQITGLGIEP